MGFLARLWFFTLRTTGGAASGIGVLLVIIGAVLAAKQHPIYATACISVGGSLVAAAVVTFLSPQSEELYQKLLSLGITEIYPSRNAIPSDRWCQWLVL